MGIFSVYFFFSKLIMWPCRRKLQYGSKLPDSEPNTVLCTLIHNADVQARFFPYNISAIEWKYAGLMNWPKLNNTGTSSGMLQELILLPGWAGSVDWGERVQDF